MLAPEIFNPGASCWRREEEAVKAGQLARILSGIRQNKQHIRIQGNYFEVIAWFFASQDVKRFYGYLNHFYVEL
jgi:hypothetical protein